jgi:hypothetical protein
MFQIIKKTNIDFVTKRYYAFVFSGILMILGIVAIVTMLMGKANLGIDFGGGTMIEGYFDKPVTISNLRAAMGRNGYSDANIQSLTRDKSNYYVIRVKSTTDEAVTQVSNNILSVLEKEFPENKFNMDSVDGIGPAVGKTLQHQTRIAVLLAMVGILIYIWIRFDFRFGVAATIATFPEEGEFQLHHQCQHQRGPQPNHQHQPNHLRAGSDPLFDRRFRGARFLLGFIDGDNHRDVFLLVRSQPHHGGMGTPIPQEIQIVQITLG